MRTLLWNKLAQQDYFDIIDYLLKHWSEKEAQHFIDRVSEIEYLLEKGNVDFQNTNRPTIKRCVITKQITLFYRNNDANTVELLRFWNNYQDLKNLNL